MNLDQVLFSHWCVKWWVLITLLAVLHIYKWSLETLLVVCEHGHACIMSLQCDEHYFICSDRPQVASLVRMLLP